MTGHWFRFYDGVVGDPKVQRLPAPLFRLWVNLLCLSSDNGGILPSTVDLTFSLRMTEKQLSVQIGHLKAAGLIDETEVGMEPHNWNGRQFKADVSTDRVRAFRERKLKHNETVSRNAPEQRQSRDRAETEQNTVPPPNKETRNKISSFNGNGIGKNGKEGVTIKDPSDRLARFQKALAESFPKDGWSIVMAAADPECTEHLRCLDLCKRQARTIGKGWPLQWPSAEVKH